MRVRRVLRFFGRALWELVRGLGLIGRGIHRALYRRYRARLWWYYVWTGLGVYLYLTGQLREVIFALLTLAIVLFGLWLMVTAPFRAGRRGR